MENGYRMSGTVDITENCDEDELNKFALGYRIRKVYIFFYKWHNKTYLATIKRVTIECKVIDNLTKTTTIYIHSQKL